jgi:hypothetical protein
MAVGVACLATACIPTAARKNAKLESGGNVDFIGGAQFAFEGVDETGATTEASEGPHAEVDIELAKAAEDSSSGYALQLKVPLNIFFTSLDAYYQLRSSVENVYWGVGAELGIAPGIYGVVTRYLSDELFVTLTPRLLFVGNWDNLALNPQLAIGYDGAVELSFFASYSYVSGDGINVDPDLFGDDAADRRKEYAMAGLSARF